MQENRKCISPFSKYIRVFSVLYVKEDSKQGIWQSLSGRL